MPYEITLSDGTPVTFKTLDALAAGMAAHVEALGGEYAARRWWYDTADRLNLSRNAFRKVYSLLRKQGARRTEIERQKRQAAARAAWRTANPHLNVRSERIPISPGLQHLRNYVLKRSHNRIPKWRFRLGADEAVQIQARPGERRDHYALFKGVTLVGPGISGAAFATGKASASANLWRIEWRLGPGDPDSWTWEPTTWRGRPNTAGFCQEMLDDLRERGLRPLRDGTFDRLEPSMLFAPSCLICGKELTDPISMARLIGPECYGSGADVAPILSIVSSERERAADMGGGSVETAILSGS